MPVDFVVADGDIWTSSDSGVTWIDRTTQAAASAQSWVGLASSSSGAHLVATTAYVPTAVGGVALPL